MKRIVKIVILSFLLLTAAISSCRRLPDLNTDPVVARVGERELHRSDLAGVVSVGIVGEDSIQVVETYIEGWARRYIKLDEAERMLKDNKDIERQIREYREALLIRNIDLYYGEQAKDTTVTETQIADYYAVHKAEFMLDRTIVKGIVVRVPVSYRQQARLKELLTSPQAPRRQDFRDMAVKNGFEMREFTTWTAWNDFVAMLPEGEKVTAANAVTGKYTETTFGNYKYMLFVDSALKNGDTAPLERVSESIARIIRNARINDAIRTNEDSLFRAGLASGEIELGIKN